MRERAAVERPGGGALCPKIARMSKARRLRLRCPCPHDGGCAPEIRRLCVVFPARSRDSGNGGCGRGPRWVPPILFVLGLRFLSSFDLHRNYFLWIFRFMTESIFPAQRQATTGGGDQHGRRPAVVAQQVCTTTLSWLGFFILSVDPIRIEIFLSSSFHSDFFTQNSIYSLDRLTDTIVISF